jgi:hypothetical protein
VGLEEEMERIGGRVGGLKEELKLEEEGLGVERKLCQWEME